MVTKGRRMSAIRSNATTEADHVREPSAANHYGNGAAIAYCLLVSPLQALCLFAGIKTLPPVFGGVEQVWRENRRSVVDSR